MMFSIFWLNQAGELSAHPVPQSVNHPLYTSPPKMRLLLDLLGESSMLRYLRMSLLSLRPMCAPGQQLFSQSSPGSSQQNSPSTPRDFQRERRLRVWVGLSLMYPSSFSIWIMMMGPPCEARQGLIKGASAVKYSLTSYSYSLFALLISMSYIPSNLAGSPPKSHQAQTQGPGRRSTFISCFLASQRKRVIFLFSLWKSNCLGYSQ